MQSVAVRDGGTKSSIFRKIFAFLPARAGSRAAGARVARMARALVDSDGHRQDGLDTIDRASSRLATYGWRRGFLAFAVATMGLVDLFSALLSHPSDRLLALPRLAGGTAPRPCAFLAAGGRGRSAAHVRRPHRGRARAPIAARGGGAEHRLVSETASRDDPHAAAGARDRRLAAGVAPAPASGPGESRGGAAQGARAVLGRRVRAFRLRLFLQPQRPRGDRVPLRVGHAARDRRPDRARRGARPPARRLRALLRRARLAIRVLPGTTRVAAA